jgi:hypothetical protein
MARAGIGPIRDGGGSSKPAGKTKAQIEAEERARAAAASKAAAERAEAARRTKAEVERQERAEASKAAQIARDRAASAAAFKASGLSASGYVKQVEAQERAAEAKRAADAAAAAKKAADAAAAARRAADAKREADAKRNATQDSRQDSSNSGNAVTSGDDSGGSGQSATPPSFQDSTGSSSPTITAPAPVKSAPIDTVLFNDESFSEEFLVDILFEDINGQELLTIARGDTVNGQEVIYQPIKNLGLLQNVYNPSSLLGLTETSASFFSGFSIQLNSKIPTIGRQSNGKNYYIEESSGSLVVELINMQTDDQVEIQLATSGTIDRLGI